MFYGDNRQTELHYQQKGKCFYAVILSGLTKVYCLLERTRGKN